MFLLRKVIQRLGKEAERFGQELNFVDSDGIKARTQLTDRSSAKEH